MVRKARFDVFISLNQEENEQAEKALEIEKTWHNIFMKGVKTALEVKE